MRAMLIVLTTLKGTVLHCCKAALVVFVVMNSFFALNSYACTSDLIPFKNLESQWGYISRGGKVLIEPHFDEAGAFCEGLAAVRTGKLWGFINKLGEEIIPPSFNEAANFSEGLAPVATEGKWTFIDSSGKKICTLKLLGAKPFSEGLASATGFNDQGDVGTGYIDHRWNWVVPPIYDDAGLMVKNRGAVKKNGLWGFVDKTGAMVIPASFLNVKFPTENVIPVQFGNPLTSAWGFIHLDGSWAIKPTFYSVNSFSDGLAGVAVIQRLPYAGFQSGYVNRFQWGFINHQGIYQISPRYWSVSSFEKNVAQVQLTSLTGGPAGDPTGGDFVCIDKIGIITACP